MDTNNHTIINRVSSQINLINRGEADLIGVTNLAFDEQVEGSDKPPVANEVYYDNTSCIRCSNKANAVLRLPEERYNYEIKQTDNPTFREWVFQKTKQGCTRKVFLKRVPILSWLPEYNVNFAVSDLVAGITVGLTIIPQAIAYSNVGGFPPEIGLYSSFMACFVYTIFGSAKDTAMGPTAIAALLAKENNHGFGVDGAVFLCFLSGCVQLLMGLLQLGFLIDFISGPVSIGFTSAAAIIIASTQVKHILGLNFSTDNFVHVWENIFTHLPETRPWDLMLGVTCIVVILFLKKSKDIQVGPADSKDRKQFHIVISKCIWLISISRNMIVVVFCAVLAYLFEIHEYHPFVLTGYVKPGLPEIKSPPFSTQVDNTTYNFVDMATTVGPGFLVLPILGILETIALEKVFAEGKAIDATQEMLALGLCNIASSFVGSMPITGALSRGAVNHASGVKTTFGGVYTGIIVLLSLHLFTPCFYYIPKASLAAVIIAAVVFMVELHVIKPIWRTKKSDLIPAIVTFFCCLFLRLELGIAIGIGINLLSLLYASARPSVHVQKLTSPAGCEYLLITPDRSLAFPSAEYVRATVTKAGVKQGESSIPVILDAKHIHGADFTAAKGIKLLIEDFIKRNQPIIFYNVKPSVISIFQGVQPQEFVHCQTYKELDDTLQQYCFKLNTIACDTSKV